MSRKVTSHDNPDYPGSAPEIKKLPRTRCLRCGMLGCKPIVDGGKCRNDVACSLRVERQKREKEMRA